MLACWYGVYKVNKGACKYTAITCRSGITAGGQVGKHLHMHPATVVTAVFPQVAFHIGFLYYFQEPE